MPDSLNPILNPDCECPAPAAIIPTACETPNPVSFAMDILDDVCDPCPAEIVPPPAVIPGLVIPTKCYAGDPAYSYVQAVDTVEGSGNIHDFFELHPACIRPIQDCQFCVENATCPEDIGLVYRKGFDNVFSATPVGAVQPLLFFVHDSYLDRVMSEVGYIKVMQHNQRNEWMPKDCFQSEFALSPHKSLDGAMQAFFNEMPMIGTLPTVVTETPAVSIVP